MKMKYEYKKLDGKMKGTGGWSAEHEGSSCSCYTGLYKGNKVIALFVAKGHFDEISQEVKGIAEEITSKLNSHAALVSALEFVASHGYSGGKSLGDLPIIADALKLAKGE